MTVWLLKSCDSEEQGIHYKLILVESLIFLIPFLIIALIIYQGNYVLDLPHVTLLIVVLLLILAGLVILRQIFDKISNVAVFMKNAQNGDMNSIDIKKDITELHDISVSFNALVHKLERSTDELSHRALELMTIKELSEITKKSLHMDDLLGFLLDKAMTVTGTQIGSIFTIDESSRRFRIIASRGSEDFVKQNDYLNIDDSISKWVLAEKKPLLVQDIEKDERTMKTNGSKYGSPSFLSMPIFTGTSISAILNLSDKHSGQPFDQYDEQVLSIMLGEISFALENAVLHATVEKQLEEIKERNAKLEQEVTERQAIEKNLALLNRKMEEANDQLGTAYIKMKENRDELRETLFREDIAFVLNNEGLIEGVTERVIEYTNKARAQLIGMPLSELLEENCRNDLRNELKKAWIGITRQITVELMSESFDPKPFELKLTRLNLADKRFLLATLR